MKNENISPNKAAVLASIGSILSGLSANIHHTYVSSFILTVGAGFVLGSIVLLVQQKSAHDKAQQPQPIEEENK